MQQGGSKYVLEMTAKRNHQIRNKTYINLIN